MTLVGQLRLLLLFGVAAAAGLVMDSRARPGGSATTGVLDDPATAKHEYLRGLSLAEEGHYQASLRSLERARSYAAGVLWEFHFNIAAGLYNSTREQRSAAGHPILVCRSSIERVANMRGALEESERAESLATAPEERSMVLLARSQMLRHWGLAWDGLDLIRRARSADPRSARAAAEFDAYRVALRHPATAGPVGEPGVAVAPAHASDRP